MADLKQLNAALVNNGVIYQWLPDGKKKGKEWVATNPTRADKHPGSFLVNIYTGRWSDFATGDKGDLIELYCYLNKIEKGEAIKELSTRYGLTTINYQNNNGSENRKKIHTSIEKAVDAVLWYQTEKLERDAKLTSKWNYNDRDGNTILFVCRIDFGTNGSKKKEFVPISKIKGGWQIGDSQMEKLPLYHLDKISRSQSPVVFCEGEKAANAAAIIFPEYIPTTTAHGAQSPTRTDFTPLRGREVLIWRDNDDAGLKYQQEVICLCQEFGVKGIEILDLPKSIPQKWDAADAISDGTTRELIDSWRVKIKSFIDVARETIEKTDKEDVNTWLGIVQELAQNSADINPMLLDGFLKEISKRSGISARAISETYKKFKPTEELKETQHYDSKLPAQSVVAKMLATKIDELSFDPTSKDWMRYDGNGVWVDMDESEIFDAISKMIDSSINDVGYSSNFVEGVIKFLRGDTLYKDWNCQRGLIPMKNGVLSLATKELLPHSQEYRFTWKLPYDFDEKADCPTIKEWLNEAVDGDEDIIKVLRAFGKALIVGGSHYQKYLELLGTGGTGKGTFIRLLTELVGNVNAHTTDFKRLETVRFEPAAFYGKRLIIIPDAEKYAGDVSMFKRLTGQDLVPYELKHITVKRHNSGFIYDGMVVVAANDIPKTSDRNALDRRRITVGFNKKGRFVRDLQKEFEPEIPGFFNWCITLPDEFLDSIMRDHVKYSRNLSKIQVEVMMQTNSIAAWMSEAVVYRPDFPTPVGMCKLENISIGSEESQTRRSFHSYRDYDKALYPNYLQFCLWHAIKKPVNHNNFSKNLVDLCTNQLDLQQISIKKTNKGIIIVGLKIRDDDDTDPSPLEIRYTS